MRKFNLLSTLLLTIVSVTTVFGQDFSNKGKDFWLCFPSHLPSGGQLAQMSLYITSDKNSSGTVTYNGQNHTFTVTANTVTEVPIVRSAAYIPDGESNTAVNKGINVKVDAGQPAVVVYAHIYAGVRTTASLILPTNVLGKQYRTMSYYQASTGGSRSQFQIIAVEPNTLVQVQLRRNGVLSGTPLTVSLPNVGDVYQIQDAQDLTGTLLEAVADAGESCKKIAVFSGSSALSLGGQGCTATSYDPLYQQCYPITSWGKNFGVIPIVNNPNGYQARVMASEDATTVIYGGTTVVLQAGEFYPASSQNVRPISTPIFISADKPISVAQYMMSYACTGGDMYSGDPDMIILNPIEQNIENVTLFTSTKEAILQQYMNVLIKTSAAPSFRINGAPPPGTFIPMPSNPDYSYLQHTFIPVGENSYTLTADEGFNVMCYGVGYAESYGYSGGTNVQDLYQTVGTATPYGGSNTPAMCVETSTRFKMSFPYPADAIVWDFNGAQTPSVVTLNSPTADSTTVVNGKTIYWYSLPDDYTFSTAGTYPINYTVQGQNIDGCGTEQEYDFELVVYDKPVAEFDITVDGCVTNPVLFTDNSTIQAGTPIDWHWNFGDGNTSGANNPSHSYTAAGTYTVKYSLITSIGCKSDTTAHTVELNDPPVANFNVEALRCPGEPVIFHDNSSTSFGTLTEWTWNFGDGTPDVVVATNASQSHTYASADTYIVTLIVKTSTGCESFKYEFEVIVNPNPVSDFSFPDVCLPSGSTQFTDLSTVSGAGNSITNWQWDFGDGSPTVSGVQHPLHIYTGTGPYPVKLTVTTNNGCTNTATTNINTIYAEPVAAFNALPEVCVGSLIGFSDASTAPGSTVTGWSWDFNDGSPIVTTQNPSHIFSTPGSYTVTLNVTSAVGCQTINNFATHTVVVNPLPTASFTSVPPYCANTLIGLTSTSVPNAGSIIQYNWTANGNPIGNTPVISYVPPAPGSYIIALNILTDKGCAGEISTPVTINPKPVADFTLPGNICLPAGTATFTNTSSISDASSLSYLWDFGDGNTSPATNPTHNYTSVNNYMVRLTAMSVNGCVDVKDQLVNTVFDEPQAAFTAPAEVCVGVPTLFTDGSNAPASSVTGWSWNFDDGSPVVTTQNPSHIFSAPGTYIVRLEVTSAAGCQTVNNFATRTIIVNPLPTADFIVSDPGCERNTVEFTDISVANAGNIVSWQWNFADAGSGPANISTLQNPEHIFEVAGTYHVQLSVVTDKGCTAQNFVRAIVINEKPQAGFITPESCTSDMAPFADTSKITAGGVVAWQWNFGDPNATPGNPNTSTLQNPAHGYTAMGSYTTQLIAISDKGCTDTVSHSFFVNGAVLNADFTLSNEQVLCSNREVVLEDASTVEGNALRIEIYWDYLNDPTAKTVVQYPVAGTPYAYAYPEFGTPASRQYRIHYVVYSGQNCLNSVTKDITLLATPSLQFDALAPVCSADGSFLVTQAQMTNNIPALDGLYSGTGITAAGLFNPSVAGPGLHTIRYTVAADNGCSNYIEQTLRVNETPPVNAGPDKVVLQGGQVDLTPAVSASLPVTYLWTPSTGLSNATVVQPAASPEEDITYTLTVTTAEGCSSSDDVFVKVLKKPAIPNIFSPNGDGIHDRWVVEHLESYPGCTVDIYNRYGQQIYHSVGYLSPWDGTVNGKPVPVGTYYYIINPKNGRSQMTGYVDVIR